MMSWKPGRPEAVKCLHQEIDIDRVYSYYRHSIGLSNVDRTVEDLGGIVTINALPLQ